MRNEARRGWLCLSITSIDFALMPPVKLQSRKGGGGEGGDQAVHVAQLQYILHIVSLPPFVPTTVLGQHTKTILRRSNMRANRRPKDTLKHPQVFTFEFHTNKQGMCVSPCVCIPFWAAEINNNNKLKMAAAALAQFSISISIDVANSSLIIVVPQSVLARWPFSGSKLA